MKITCSTLCFGSLSLTHVSSVSDKELKYKVLQPSKVIK